MISKKKYIITGVIGLLLGVGAWYFIRRKKIKEVIKENNAEVVITE
jgi:hypothetical protein